MINASEKRLFDAIIEWKIGEFHSVLLECCKEFKNLAGRFDTQEFEI